MARTNQGNRGGRSRNNNPEGRNQYSGGVMDIARERPMTAALGAAAAVGAGVFLWSRRNQISDQISNLSDQFGEWSQGRGFGEHDFSDFDDDTAGLTTSNSTGSRPTATRGRSGMSATGGGNASLGASSGGGGTTGSISGRGRGKRSPIS